MNIELNADDNVPPSLSTPQALTELTAHIEALLGETALDPRFARKLLKRIAKEADAIGERQPRDAALDAALGRLSRAVNTVQADELVAAASALRSAPGSPAE